MKNSGDSRKTTTQDPLDKIFSALADKTRRQLVHRLAESELSMNQLAEGFEISLAAISKHVKVLEAAKLVNRRIEGRVHHISLRAQPLTEALDWISIYRNFWQNKMSSLSALIKNEEEK